jgi:hypothetical protein
MLFPSHEELHKRHDSYQDKDRGQNTVAVEDATEGSQPSCCLDSIDDQRLDKFSREIAFGWPASDVLHGFQIVSEFYEQFQAAESYTSAANDIRQLSDDMMQLSRTHMDWCPNFCLACDGQTTGTAYCSETCRLADCTSKVARELHHLDATQYNNNLFPTHQRIPVSKNHKSLVILGTFYWAAPLGLADEEVPYTPTSKELKPARCSMEMTRDWRRKIWKEICLG